MKDYNSNNMSAMNEELIKRYHEIYYDFNTEYKNISVSPVSTFNFKRWILLVSMFILYGACFCEPCVGCN